ncbi:sensor histidine kinase [Sphingomonas sp.]|uniref:sensor histidine kinase n=1 Tax=Sphingomonas sp. TaxID=28214 RepID=UPI003AFF67A1
MIAFGGSVRGLVDGDGRLAQADEALAGLHERAGGEPGGPLAVPQLAALARLVRRLDMPVARAVLAGDGEEDVDLWVRARPEEQGVALVIAGWSRRAPAPPLPDESQAAGWDRLRAEADWTWEADVALRLTAISREGSAALAIGAASGDALTRLLSLDESDDGGVPLLVALADGRGFEDQRVTVRATGTRFRLAAAPIVDASGRVRGFRGGGFALEDEASASDQAAGPGFAHRFDAALRAPLQRIVASAEAMREQADGPIRVDYGAYAGDIADAGRHLLGLVGDLVDLETVEREVPDVEAEPVDMADLARRAAGLLSVRADDRAILIERPDEDATLPATGDFRRALQVLVNLIGNAVRFGPEGSRVGVSVEQRDGVVAAIVRDQGRGIPAGDRERVFDKFERLGAAEPGSGLGLYISRRLARAMAGDVVVEDSDVGARLVFTLPDA